MADLIERQALVDRIEGIRAHRGEDDRYDDALCDVLDILSGWCHPKMRLPSYQSRAYRFFHFLNTAGLSMLERPKR